MLIRHFPLWKQAPFLRLVIPFISGIACGWYLKPALILQISLACASIAGYTCTIFYAGFSRYRWNWTSGLMLFTFIFSLGNFAIFRQDIRNDKHWLGTKEAETAIYCLRLTSAPIDKTYYYSASAEIAVQNFGYPTPKGGLIIRIQKDSTTFKPAAGDLLLTRKPPVRIPDNANPGAFNFQFYCLQQGTTHQLYLSTGEYRLIRQSSPNAFQRWIIGMQNDVLATIRKYVPGKKQSGVAEALLIGYREDLDKSLVQAYANTGVVHIIAISGLHLGMLYGLLLVVLKPLKKLKIPGAFQFCFVLAGLWLFSLLAGASPSVLRSAVMFSFIAFGNGLGKKANIYNSLAASAFFLLWINPFFLWDLGFQLSYAAVLSIAIFQKPVMARINIKNKMLDAFWKLISISLAAQILTTPISIFQFHQQPLLFLIANAIAVPLSGIILYAEIGLLIVAKFDGLASTTGELISYSLQLLNRIIERLDESAIAVWQEIHFSFPEMIFFFLFIAGLSLWLFSKKNKFMLQASLWLFCFMGARTFYEVQTGRQERIIIYQLPAHSVIDFVSGNDFYEVIDTAMSRELSLQSFQIGPAHCKFRIRRSDSLPGLAIHYPFIIFRNKICLILDPRTQLKSFRKKMKIDLVLIRGNPRFKILELSQIVDCSLIVWDGSNAAAKTNEWKSECDALALRCHSTPLQGPLILEF